MLLATALALLITGCAQQIVYQSKTTGAEKFKGNHHPSFLRFWNKVEETVDAALHCGGAENVVKTETQQTFVNGLLGFITLGIYTRWKRVYCSQLIVPSCPSIRATYLHCSLIYFWVPSSCFCIVISLSLRVNDPVQRCLPVGEADDHAGGGGAASRTDWQTALMCNRRRPAATSSRRASLLFSFSIS